MPNIEFFWTCTEICVLLMAFAMILLPVTRKLSWRIQKDKPLFRNIGYTFTLQAAIYGVLTKDFIWAGIALIAGGTTFCISVVLTGLSLPREEEDEE